MNYFLSYVCNTFCQYHQKEILPKVPLKYFLHQFEFQVALMTELEFFVIAYSINQNLRSL